MELWVVLNSVEYYWRFSDLFTQYSSIPVFQYSKYVEPDGMVVERFLICISQQDTSLDYFDNADSSGSLTHRSSSKRFPGCLR